MASALQLNMSTIYNHRKKCGLIIPGNKRFNKLRQYEPLPALPDDWKTLEWLTEAKTKYGIRRVAELSGHSLCGLYNMMYKMGYKKQEAHPCNNSEWLYKHYITDQLTIPQCVALAGVSISTFKQWLINNNIPSVVNSKRHRNAKPGTPPSFKAVVPIWIKDLKHRLEMQPGVSKVKIKPGYLKVHYTCVTEQFHWFGQIKRRLSSFFVKPDRVKIANVGSIIYEYGVGLDGEPLYPAHFKISLDFNGMSIVEKRLTINTFLSKVTTHKWVQMTHPIGVLEHDLERCKKADVEKYFHKDVFYSKMLRSGGQEPAGYYIAEHFFKFGLGAYLCNKRYSYARYVVFRDYLKRNKTVSFRQFMRFICKHNSTRKLFGRKVKFYRDFGSIYTIFKRLNISGAVLDLSPGYGYNALAAAMAGIEYMHLPGHKIQLVLDGGFADFVNLKHKEYGGEDVDALLCHSFTLPDMELVRQYYAKARRIIVFVPKYKKDEFVAQYKPECIVKYQCSNDPRYYDWLAIW
jgi:hypothetical protein